MENHPLTEREPVARLLILLRKTHPLRGCGLIAGLTFLYEKLTRTEREPVARLLILLRKTHPLRGCGLVRLSFSEEKL